MPDLTDEAKAEIRHVAGYFRAAYGKDAVRNAVKEVLAEGEKPPEEETPKAPPKKEKEEAPPKEEEPKKSGLWWPAQ